MHAHRADDRMVGGCGAIQLEPAFAAGLPRLARLLDEIAFGAIGRVVPVPAGEDGYGATRKRKGAPSFRAGVVEVRQDA